MNNYFELILQSIPESLTARLLNVLALDVHSNQLKSLPNSIGCLSKLKILNVSGNLLQTLPKTIENCRFVLRNCYLSRICRNRNRINYKKTICCIILLRAYNLKSTSKLVTSEDSNLNIKIQEI